MTKNPIINAIAAFLYIVGIVSLIWSLQDETPQPDTIFAPLAMLSLFVLSAAVMGYVFLLEPLKLYFDGEKVRAVNLFIQTTITFAILTGGIFLILISGFVAP
jgi:hypothetical protein